MEQSNPPALVRLSEGLGPNATELADALRELDDRTNQTWAFKRKRWAALVRAQDAEIKRLRAEVDRLEPMDIALCERHSLVLRVGATYVFRPVGDCAGCADMVAKARDAYGPGLGA